MAMTELRDHPRIRPAVPPEGIPTSLPYRRLLQTGAWVVPLAVALAVGTALLVISRQIPTYRSSATVALVPGATVAGETDLLRSLETLERRTVIATFAQIPAAQRIREAAARDVSLPADSLPEYRSQGFVVPNTNLIRIEVHGPDPARATALANALVASTAAEAKAMYRVFDMTTLNRAVRPATPEAPRPRRALALAVILGAFLGLAATYLVVRPPFPGARA